MNGALPDIGDSQANHHLLSSSCQWPPSLIANRERHQVPHARAWWAVMQLWCQMVKA